MNQKIMIIAGEASGDTQGALLMKAIKRQSPEIEFIGIGGDKMIDEGLNTLFHINEIAILGLWEVMKHLFKIKKILDTVVNSVKQEKIDAVILIDYPGFNLKLAQRLYQLDIPIFYYICPQVWAWGEKRVKKIKKWITRLFVILPFEEKFYNDRGLMNVSFIGHPLIEYAEKEYQLEEFFQKYSIPKEKKRINIQPGSRVQEIEKILPHLLQLTEYYKEKNELIFILPQAETIAKEIWDKYHLEKYPNLVPVSGKDYYCSLKAADFIITASGTSTLEAAIFEKPLILVYSVNPITYYLGKYLVKLPYIGLVNIIAGKQIIPELIQNDLNSKNIIKTFENSYFNAEIYNKTKNELLLVKEKLGKQGAADKAAKMIIQNMNNEK